MHRVYADQTMAAMSLAAHLFKFENGRWPEIMEEMIPNDLPHTMIDPFGNGKQVIGYVLAKGALPDGSDRPLVYCRANAQDGLFFHANKLDFGFYYDDASGRPASQQKRYGQFRDVTLWEPRANYNGPAALPLPKLSDRMGAAIPLHRTPPANGNYD